MCDAATVQPLTMTDQPPYASGQAASAAVQPANTIEHHTDGTSQPVNAMEHQMNGLPVSTTEHKMNSQQVNTTEHQMNGLLANTMEHQMNTMEHQMNTMEHQMNGLPRNTMEHQMNNVGQPAAQAVSQDNSISSALMTAFDVDPHPPSLVELQSSSHLGPDPSSPYPYPGDGCTSVVGCSSTFLSPPPSVEQMASQCSTPCPDNESGYMTMDEQDLQSPGNLYWQQQQQYQDSMIMNDAESGYGTMNSQAYPSTVTSGYRAGAGGYPYTHQDSRYQTLHQTATCSVTSATTSNEIIYYPFNDLMQLHPSLLRSDQDASIQYVHGHPDTYPQGYPYQTATQTNSQEAGTPGRKRGRGGRPRGGRRCLASQIQSDQITSSLQRQLRAQMEAPPKRPYRRRSSNPDGRKKPAAPKAPRSSSNGDSSDDKKNRHNEPLNQKAVSIMHDWYRQHEENPYPSKDEKERMAREGGITTMQVKSWFANKRNRSNNTRPKVQKRAMEEKLMQIYNQLSKSEAANALEGGGNSFIIKELSQIIHNRFEPEMPSTPESATWHMLRWN